MKWRMNAQLHLAAYAQHDHCSKIGFHLGEAACNNIQSIFCSLFGRHQQQSKGTSVPNNSL